MMIVSQNVLSTIMLIHIELLNGNIRWHLEMLEICHARNLCSKPRISKNFFLNPIFAICVRDRQSME